MVTNTKCCRATQLNKLSTLLNCKQNTKSLIKPDFVFLECDRLQRMCVDESDIDFFLLKDDNSCRIDSLLMSNVIYSCIVLLFMSIIECL